MQPDYNEASMRLLFEILKATVSKDPKISFPPSPTAFFSPSRSDEWLNSLWFVSLTLSLITALVAVLVKQWLHQYVSIVSDSSPRDRARIRHLRYAGLQTWQVPMIIGLLPVLLHASLALFFAGLAVFLFSLGMKVAWLVSIIGAVTYMAYVVALILPLVHPYCPYKVPLAVYIHHLYRFFYDRLITPILIIQRYPDGYFFYLPRYLRNDISHIRGAISPLQCPTLKEIERDHVQKHAAEVDARSLQWLHSSTSNASVHQSVLQAIAGMSSATLECLPNEYISALMVPLDQQIQHIEPLVPSPDVERELELYYRACILLRLNHSRYGDRLHHDHMADRCCNEQLKMTLFSMTSFDNAFTVLLGIFQGPQRSSLILHSAVWKALIHAFFRVRVRFRHASAALELELELMKIIASPLSTSESGDVTTIDKPSNEMRRYIVNYLCAYWMYGYHFQMSAAIDSLDLDRHIMLALIPRIQERLCNSAHASDRKQLIETSLAIIECIGLLVRTLIRRYWDTRPVLDRLYTLLCSEAFVVVSPDLQTLVCKIFIILDKYRSRMEPVPPDIQFYSVAYQCYLHSPVRSGKSSENSMMPPILGSLISSSLNSPPASSMGDSESRETPLDPPRYPRFSTDSLFQVMLLLIKEHHESILYEWARHPAMQKVWPECLSQLVQWTSGEKFHQWVLLKRVLAVVVIGELQNMLGHSDDNESLPQYDFDVYKDVDQLPWLYEIPGSSR